MAQASTTPYKVTGEIMSFYSIFVIDAPIFTGGPPDREVPQLNSLVMEWDGLKYYRANVGEDTYLFDSSQNMANCPLDPHNDKTTDENEIELRKKAAGRFVDVFKAHPSLNDISLIVYATSKQWSRM
eukprot:GHVT01103085.1.p1 GENE.GHVT01103085.1~~GHVT01103085.1.p1  ORF type:complete len:127 (-),score=14.16 GHVT01103085.1:463-843(-)